MVDQKHGEYSRAPELKDLVSLCKNLNDSGANYILIGGFAVILHGFTRGTADIDLLVDASEGNVKKIKQALSKLPDNAVSEIEENEMQKYTVVRIADEIVVDLMAKAGEFDYSKASAFIEIRHLEGVKIPLASKQLLIKMKEATVRPSDKMDVDYLKAVIEER